MLGVFTLEQFHRVQWKGVGCGGRVEDCVGDKEVQRIECRYGNKGTVV